MTPLVRFQRWWRWQRLRRELRALNGGGGFVPAAPVLSGTYVTPETAMCLAAVFAAVNVIARDIACLPRNVYRKLTGGGREIDESHPVQPVVSTTPNAEMDGFRFFQSAMSHVLTRGNGYGEIVRDHNGTPTSIHLLHPSKTIPKRTKAGDLYYELNDGATGPDGRAKKLWAEDVLHFAGMGFDAIVGYSPVTVARQTIGLGIAVEQYGAAFFGNAAVPKGILKTATKLGEAAVNNLRRSLNQAHQGSQSAHQLMILEQGMDWVQTQFSAEDAQFLLTREFQVKEVARLYNLPPHKIGDYSESHLANVEEANLDYLAMTLFGWVVMAESQLNSKLLTAEDRKTHVIGLDMTALMRGNSQARIAYWQGLRNMGAISADEIRTGEHLNPIGRERGGQIYLVQGQYIPLEQVGKQPAQPPPPAGNPGRKSIPRSRRFNPAHNKDGTFGAGHGGAAGGGEPGQLSEADTRAVREIVADARAKGADVRVSKGAAATPAEAKAYRKAGARGGHALATTDTPRILTTRDGDVVTHRFADPLFGAEAKTYPDAKRPGRWVSERHIEGDSSPTKTSFKSRGRAMKESKDFMRDEQADSTQRAVKVVKSVPEAVKSAVDTGERPEAGKWWKTRIKVITGSES